MRWWIHRFNPIQRRIIVLVLAFEVAVIGAYGVFTKASAGPSTSAETSGKTGAVACEDAARAPNPIMVENTCPGTSGWKLDLPRGNQHDIEAFTAPVSVNV